MVRVAIASGGTGGHIYPAIAIAQELQNRDIGNEILFIGSEEGLEKKILSLERFSFKTIKARGMLRKLSFKSISAPFLAIYAVFQALKILRSFKPDILITTGGYVSLPTGIAAKLLRIPILVHEQNVTPGISSRITGFFAKKVTVSFDNTYKYFFKRKTAVTGNPVRKRIINAIKSVSLQKLNLDQKRKTLLILGGSQGARKINETVIEAIDDLCKEGLQIIHVTGERDYEFVVSKTEKRLLDIEKEIPFVKAKKRQVTLAKFKQYHPIPYMVNIWDGLAAADLVVSRAGGTAIAEITTRGLPSILIPFPFSADGHQEKNAKILEGKKAAVIVKNKELSKDSLVNIIRNLFNDPVKLKNIMTASKSFSKADAAEQIAQVIYDILGIKPQSRKKKKTIKKKTKRPKT